MSHTVVHTHLPEVVVPGKRLGRHVEHDSRSRAFALAAVPAPLVSRSWERHCAPFDQGDLGSCTGNAGVGCMMTEPFWQPGRALTEADAVKVYGEATLMDHIPGHYPPDDTGSSGVAVARALKARGMIPAYRHTFGLHALLSSLSHVGPGMLGINWYEGFDAPDGPHAELKIAGSPRGGHEVELLAIDVDAKLVRGCNSWGKSWGDGGYFVMSFATLERLLAEQGDYVVPG